MKTEKKIFDGVRMARECNERASRVLNAMTPAGRIAFLADYRLGAPNAKTNCGSREASPSLVVREETV